MKTLLSLFDYSGTWSKPFVDAGWQVIQWDIKLLEEMDIMNLDSAETLLEELGWDIDGILAAAPCTDFASSGARWWEEKDASGQTQQSVELVQQTLKIVNLFRPTDPDFDGTFFWAIENPVGRIGKLTGLEDPYYFDPYEFAGWLNPSAADLAKLATIRAKNGIDIMASEANFIFKMNAYTKRTGLWGKFNRNMVKKPLEPVKGAPQGSVTQRYGSKSAKTKEIRSNTPEGFAMAFFDANHDYLATQQFPLTQQLPLFSDL